METISTEDTGGSDRQESATSRQLQSKVKDACQRCRRQKLKCDIQRPCTLCVRAGRECFITKRDQFKEAHQPKQHRQRSAVVGNQKSPLPVNKTLRKNGRAGTRRSIGTPSLALSKQTEAIAAQRVNTSSEGNGDHNSAFKEPLWNSSSTMVLVEKAFQYHDTETPLDQTSSESAVDVDLDPNMLNTDEMATPRAPPRLHERGSPDNPSYMIPFPLKDSSPDTAALLSLLPSQEATTLIVNTYFDRVHWFTLVFHQVNFRSRVDQLYGRSRSQSSGIGDALPFISTLLAVIAIGLQYLGEYRTGILARFMIDPHELNNRILTTLRSRILDIASSGSLEAVQTCILLGSYYLYHGKPSLAIPIFGCGLRVAQALGLHRVLPRPDTNTKHLNPALHQRIEARKRCWWAIYEIDTFCSMLYGYPRSISDEDCDVDLLEPSAVIPEMNLVGSSGNSSLPQTTLLSYKYFMAKLSIIINTTLADLYGTRQNLPRGRKTNSDKNGRLQTLTKRVSDLDRALRDWHTELPQKLQIGTYKENVTDLGLAASLDRDIGACGERFETHIFRLQALALKLAYENTRILIHRQHLSFRMDPTSSSPGLAKANDELPTAFGPVHLSLQTCCDAALQTAELGSTSVFREAFDSYAVAFIGIHLFTAGVTLCITTRLNPMSIESHKMKIGIHKLMEMEALLKPKSALAAQGLTILEKLTKLILSKELEKMLDFSKSSINVTSRLDQNPPARKSTQGSSQPDKELFSQNRPMGPPQIPSAVGSPSEMPSALQNPGALLVLSEIDNDLGLSYLEDTAMAEAFLHFDQVVRNQPSNEADTACAGDFYQFDNCFADQEQAWIWGADAFPFD